MKQVHCVVAKNLIRNYAEIGDSGDLYSFLPDEKRTGR